MSKNWLFAPRDFSNGPSELRYMNKYISVLKESENKSDMSTIVEEPEDATRFYDGDSITVKLRGAMIRENKDALFFGDNDLMILSTYQFGKEPAVQKMHFMQDDVPLGWQGEFFNDIILALQDFKDTNKRLALRVQVYDLDVTLRNMGESLKSLIDGSDSIKGLAEGAIAAFPGLTPFAAFTEPLIKTIGNLAEHVEDHDRILDERIIMESASADTGHTLLQQGYYVCFNQPVTMEQAKYLREDMTILDAKKEEFKDFSYAIVELDKKFEEGVDLEIDQKAAKLASELAGKGQSGKAALDFLRDTLSTYKDFKDLQREDELTKKEKAKTISQSEIKLLKKLRDNERIKPYIPDRTEKKS